MYGSILGIDKKKVIKDEDLSVYEGVVAPWSGIKLSKWKDRFISKSIKYDFPIHRAYKELSEKEKNILWNGYEKCKGINQFFDYLETKKYKIQARVLIARYRGKTSCDECQGYFIIFFIFILILIMIQSLHYFLMIQYLLQQLEVELVEEAVILNILMD